METPRAWALAGLAAGAAGLAASYFAAMVLNIRESPVVAAAELVVRLTPGAVVERAIDLLGRADKVVLVLGILVVLAGLLAWAGRLARDHRWAPLLVHGGLALVGALAVLVRGTAQPVDLLPVAVGFVTWVLGLRLLTVPLRGPGPRTGEAGTGPAAREATRRTLLRSGVAGAGAAVLAVSARVVGGGRRHVEDTRRLLKIPGVTAPRPPAGSRVDVPGMAPWATPTEDFYLIHTAMVVPTVEPGDWTLRIHGLVDREVVLTYADLLSRRLTEAWVTLTCVSNEVGGPLVGNAWWSGVRIADLLSEAGVQPGADAVLQTSHDGWTCGTPLGALTDGRDALLAVAMNGRPLPVDHGFPVRTVVPGLYGFVSATKWVVDLEVTRFADFTAFWTDRGWSSQGPVKLASRIDVPRSGDSVAAGDLRVGGVAWAQHTGVEAVEVAVDGGAWQPAELARTASVDTWVQWSATVRLDPGDHLLRVRATDRDGQVQTGVLADTRPDGATGWHEVDVTAEA